MANAALTRSVATVSDVTCVPRQPNAVPVLNPAATVALQTEAHATCACVLRYPLLAVRSVNCTFIKPNGKRVTVPGRVGWSLLKTAQHHDVGLEGWEASSSWLEDYGEGPATTADHVVVANEWADKLEPIYPEEEKLLQTVDHAVENSRLAAVIKLRKELDGITVYIPPENMSFKGYNF